VRDIVHVKIVHGSWKEDDAQRLRLEESAKRYPNVQILIAYMPEAFGTHHSKMMVLIRHDDTAQVVIHTANMIPQDWANLSQAVWRSPLLPLLATASSSDTMATGLIGTGLRFKYDLLRYLNAYSGRTKSLVDQLKQYHFGSIRAALIASTPIRARVTSSKPTEQTSWGWLGLKEILSTIQCEQDVGKQPSVVLQVSSIATLTEKWFENFFDVLSANSSRGSSQAANKFFAPTPRRPKFNVIFPTGGEIRQSLDGYASGSSIHMKLQSTAQGKQLSLMRPMLCYWMGDNNIKGVDEQDSVPKREALRRQAAPHIKTYIRFSGPDQKFVEWGMVTSANLSQQAWGALPDKDGIVRICSYEIGVVVWPDLFRDAAEEEVKMVPVFGKDTPVLEDLNPETNDESGQVADEGAGSKQVEQKPMTVIGFRMPYNLPLVPYKSDDLPWCATSQHNTPDWLGRVWGGYEPR
jgi:tyrosyl-DNA phosphodiesterase 1